MGSEQKLWAWFIAAVLLAAIAAFSYNAHDNYLNAETMQVGLAAGNDPMSMRCGVYPYMADKPTCSILASKMDGGKIKEAEVVPLETE